MKQYHRSEKENKQLVFGIRPVIEAIRSGKDIEAVYVQHGLKGSLFHELSQLLSAHQVVIHQVPVEKLKKLSSKNHQGVIAVVSLITYQKIEDIVPLLFEQGLLPLILILDRVTDVRNLGAIARTAVACGVHALVLPTKESAQINADAIKTSAGALYKIPVCRHHNLLHIVNFIRESGIQLICCTEKTSNLLYQADYTLPTAILLGSEHNGVSNDLQGRATHLAKIPLYGPIESLNVSVSAGIILYEAIRQRIFAKLI